MRAWLVAVIALAGCRNVLGIANETTVETHSISGMVNGVVGSSGSVEVTLSIEGVVTETQTFTQDLPFTFAAVPNESAYEVTASAGCVVDNGMGFLDSADAIGINVRCAGELGLADYGFSAPLELSPRLSFAVTAYTAKGSYLTRGTALAPVPQFPTAIVTAFYKDNLVADPTFVQAALTGDEARVEVAREVGGPAVTYRAVLDLDGLPAQFGYGKADTSNDGDELGAVMAASFGKLVVGLPHRGNGEVVLFVRKGQRWVQQTKLTAPAGAIEFGASVAIDDLTILVGAPGENSNAGAIYEFRTTDGTSYPRVGRVGGAASARLGEIMVARSQIVVSSALGEMPGRVYLYALPGLTPLATANNPSAAPGDRFGAALSFNGTHLLVGAPGSDTSPPNSLVDAGSAHLFAIGTGMLMNTENYAAPDPDAYDQFGAAVVVSRASGMGVPPVAIGAPFEDSMNPTSGAVYLWAGDPSGVPGTVLKSPTPDRGDGFGWSLAFEADLLVVGAPFEDSGTPGVFASAAGDDNVQDAGAVYTFTASTSTLRSYIKASDPRRSDHFGTCVQLQVDSLLVGAPTEDSPSTGWNQSQDGGDLDDDRGAVYTFR